MKKIIFAAGILATFVWLSACSSPRPMPADRTTSEHTIIQVDHPVSLTTLLQRAPGVYVEERGPNSRVLIRGRQPLFVIDGVQIGRNYGQVLNLVDINTVTAVEVLKNANETFMYGRQGANGVIVIHTGLYELEN